MTFVFDSGGDEGVMADGRGDEAEWFTNVVASEENDEEDPALDSPCYLLPETRRSFEIHVE